MSLKYMKKLLISEQSLRKYKRVLQKQNNSLVLCSDSSLPKVVKEHLTDYSHILALDKWPDWLSLIDWIFDGSSYSMGRPKMDDELTAWFDEREIKREIVVYITDEKTKLVVAVDSLNAAMEFKMRWL